jgi:uncharacterized protein YqhQ
MLHGIGGRAHAHGIMFESDWARVTARDNGRDTVKLFSARSRRVKAALRKVPLLRAFSAFSKAGTAIFIFLSALILTDVFAPEALHFEIYMEDMIFYSMLIALAVAALLAAALTRSRVKRTLQYHGAEHMALNTCRRGLPLTPENISRADRATPSCGSVFVLVFLFIGVPLMFVPYSDCFLLVALGAAFELTVLARRVRWLRPLLRFGMWLQRRVWTRPPDAAQIEVARRGLTSLIGLMNREEADAKASFPPSGQP